MSSSVLAAGPVGPTQIRLTLLDPRTREFWDPAGELGRTADTGAQEVCFMI